MTPSYLFIPKNVEPPALRQQPLELSSRSYLMACWPCIIAHQYSETNVMHFLFNIFRVNGHDRFRASLAHPQETLDKRHFGILRARCVSWLHQMQPTDTTRMQFTNCHLCITSWGWASDARNMYRPLILNKLNRKCILLVFTVMTEATYLLRRYFFSAG
jgi:hypothetical protein